MQSAAVAMLIVVVVASPSCTNVVYYVGQLLFGACHQTARRMKSQRLIMRNMSTEINENSPQKTMPTGIQFNLLVNEWNKSILSHFNAKL